MNPVLCDDMAMKTVALLAQAGTCKRGGVGAIFVLGTDVKSAAFNTSVFGLPSCQDEGCLLVEGHCVRTVHAEAGAIAHAAKYGTGLNGCTLYCTLSPCWSCFKLLSDAGIERVVYGRLYAWDDETQRVHAAAKTVGIEMVHYAHE